MLVVAVVGDTSMLSTMPLLFRHKFQAIPFAKGDVARKLSTFLAMVQTTIFAISSPSYLSTCYNEIEN